MAFDQGFKGWIGVASISLSVNRGSWTGFIYEPNFHDSNAMDPTWSTVRDIGIGPLRYDFCQRPYLHNSTASQSTAETSVDCPAVLLSCQIAELWDFRTKNSHNWLNVSLFISIFWQQVDNNHGRISGIWVIWIQYRENSLDSDLKWSSIILSQKIVFLLPSGLRCSLALALVLGYFCNEVGWKFVWQMELPSFMGL